MGIQKKVDNKTLGKSGSVKMENMREKQPNMVNYALFLGYLLHIAYKMWSNIMCSDKNIVLFR